MKPAPQAFPVPGFYHPDSPEDYDNWPRRGMTLRDWFAGAALVGILAHPEASGGLTHSEIARASYDAADAMLEEREKS